MGLRGIGGRRGPTGKISRKIRGCQELLVVRLHLFILM